MLAVQDLTVVYGLGCEACLDSTGPLHGTNRCSACGAIVACAGVGFRLYAGEVLGIVGESGSGKSTVLQALYQDVRPMQGSAHYRGFAQGQRSIWDADASERRKLRTHAMAMVYQNPRQGLRLTVTAGGNIAERLLASEWRRVATIRERAADYLGRTEVPIDRMDDLPAFFSGGMQQRVQIAKALANNPELVFLDELTTGLDVSVQAGVLDLVRDIRRRHGLTMILVSHDLRVVRMLADRTLVMRHGRVVEAGLTDQILQDPQHPYAQLLVSSAA